MLRSYVLLLATLGAGTALSTTIEIAPGVHMPRINLGTCCGSKPAVGLGPWLDNGGVGIDTAFDYSDQADIATVLKARKLPRSSFFVTTKIPAGFGANKTDCDAQSGPDVAMKYVVQDLKELGLEYVDLVLLHAPCQKFGTLVPMPSSTLPADPDASNRALWRGLEAMVVAGMTRAIGVSNYNRTQLVQLKVQGGTVPAVNQCEMSLTGSFGQQGHDEDTIAYCQEHNITYESYGALKGCPTSDATLVAIAEAHHVSAVQVCLRWILQRGAIVATGTGSNATKVSGYAKSDFEVYDNPVLTDTEMHTLNNLQHQ